LDKVLERAIRLKKAQELANLAKAKEIVAGSTTATKDPFATSGKTDWYFSNAMLVSQGRTNFMNRWEIDLWKTIGVEVVVTMPHLLLVLILQALKIHLLQRI
jgi:hypothetical protein